MLMNVKTSSHNYDIVIEKGVFNRIADEISDVATGKLFIITDENVHKLYGTKIKDKLCEYDVDYMVLPSGETTKSLNMLSEIYSALANSKITRTDTIIAFGGGVIGDITGFAASTFLRGVKFIQIPTTLLSQVDSSVGGKVAVNLEQGKNLVGSFYPPAKVIIDTEFLNTLPKRVFSDGMAEVIKYACIRDKELFHILSGDTEDCMDEIVHRCLEIKRAVVEKDEFDTGERMILNFGHTFGHAVEKMYGYGTYTHGEAVAIGMLKITEATEKMGYTAQGTAIELKNLLGKYELLFPDFTFDSNEAQNIMSLDKKGDGDSINYIFIREIGKCEIVKMSKDKMLF